jgi:hypothetical protein
MPGPGPSTSEDATTEVTASDIGRTASVEDGRLIALAVAAFPGSPATMMTPVFVSTNG